MAFGTFQNLWLFYYKNSICYYFKIYHHLISWVSYIQGMDPSTCSHIPGQSGSCDTSPGQLASTGEEPPSRLPQTPWICFDCSYNLYYGHLPSLISHLSTQVGFLVECAICWEKGLEEDTIVRCDVDNNQHMWHNLETKCCGMNILALFCIVRLFPKKKRKKKLEYFS